MKKLLPILLLLLGGGGGVGAGLFLRPAAPEPELEAAVHCAEGDAACEAAQADDTEPVEGGDSAAAADADQTSDESVEGSAGSEYVALQRQMIVPIVNGDQVISLVVMSLSLEVESGFTDDVYNREPKLRDAFLRVLFRHANTGGFSGDFTSGEKMSDLRRALNGAAAQVLGPVAIQVLVTDILRQET